jgi:hypothetical protein
MSRRPEGPEVIYADQCPTSRVLLGVSAVFDSHSLEFLDFGALLNNGNGEATVASDDVDPTLYATLPIS